MCVVLGIDIKVGSVLYVGYTHIEVKVPEITTPFTDDGEVALIVKGLINENENGEVVFLWNDAHFYYTLARIGPDSAHYSMIISLIKDKIFFFFFYILFYKPTMSSKKRRWVSTSTAVITNAVSLCAATSATNPLCV